MRGWWLCCVADVGVDRMCDDGGVACGVVVIGFVVCIWCVVVYVVGVVVGWRWWWWLC